MKGKNLHSEGSATRTAHISKVDVRQSLGRMRRVFDEPTIEEKVYQRIMAKLAHVKDTDNLLP